MKIEVFADPEGAAREAARIVAAEARKSAAERGQFAAAFSGGHTPWVMLRALANEDVPWDKVHIVQVDERVAPCRRPRSESHTSARKPTRSCSAISRSHLCDAGRRR